MHGEYKVPGGKLVVIDVEVFDGRLVAPRLAGDFFAEPDDVVERINEALTGLPADAMSTEIGKAIDAVIRPDDVLFGFAPADVAIALRRALGKAVGWEDLTFEVMHGPVIAPEENIALDEVLPGEMAAGRRGPMLRFWEWNAPLLVMGSFQSYDNEINPEGVARHNITVSRRITGGGAMFMEPGNCITYSLYVPQGLVDGLDFAQSYEFLDHWVMEALEQVGVHARYVPLNDIASDKGKIGGAAQKRFASGVLLHHVTMSYDIDATKMLDVMRIGQEKLRDKGTRSAAKRVDPMRSQTGMTREAIIEVFMRHFREKYNCIDSQVRPEELEAARQLAGEKFTADWWVHRIP